MPEERKDEAAARGPPAPARLPSVPCGEPGLDRSIAVRRKRRASARRRYLALRESEERFRLASMAARALIYDVDVAGSGLAKTFGLAELAGYPDTGGRLTSEWWHSLIHPDDLPAHFAILERYSRCGGRLVSTYRVRHADGRWIWVRDSTEMMLDDEGKLARIVGTIVDITEQRHAGESLAFLAALSEALMPQHSIDSVVHAAAERIASHFGATRVTFSDVSEAGDAVTVYASRRDPGLKDDRITHRLADYLGPGLVRELAAGRTVAIGDVAADPRTAPFAAAYQAFSIGSVLLAPYLSGGQWRFLIAVHKGAAYTWRADEIALLGEISSRVHLRLERARSEAELARSEARFRAMANTTPAIIWTADPAGRITFHNRRWLDYTGIDPADNATDWARLVLHPDDYDRCMSAWRHALATGTDYEIEVRNRHHSGVWRWFLTRATPIRDSDGSILSWYGSTTDIHDRKQLEAELRESERRFRTLFTAIDEGYCLCEIVCDAAGRPVDYRFLEVNPLFESMTGLADAVGRTAYELVPNLEPHWVETYGRVALQQETLRFEQTSAAMDRSFDVFATHVEPRGRFALVFKDVTERKRAEKALRESEERFRTIVTTAQEGIWAVDRKGRTLFANPRLAEMLGSCVEAMAGRPISDFCFPEDLDDGRARVAANLAGLTEEFEYRFRRANGTPLHVLAATAPLRGPDGQIIGALGGFVDLTERRKAEERQRVLMREIAHRGKNLLAVVQSIAGRTLADDRPLAEARQAFIGRLQALSRTYSSLTDEVFEGALLGEIVASELQSFGVRARMAGPKLMLPAKVAQTFTLIIHELATNAAKYGALSVPGGHLDVRWQVVGDDGSERGRRFAFEWIEAGGPAARVPARRGFGTTLISKVAGTELRCTPEITFGETGFRYRLDAPLSVIGTVIQTSPVRERLLSETLKAFHDAWAGRHGPDGRLPTLKEFPRERFARTGGLTIAEADAGCQVRFVEVGRALTERHGGIVEHGDLARDDPDAMRQACERCALGAVPWHESLRFDFGEGHVVTFERLLLPFSRGGSRVTHIAGLVVFSGGTLSDEQARPRA